MKALVVFVVGLTFCYGFDERFLAVLSDIQKESIAEATQVETGTLPDWLDGRL